jgi:hypothetical protein
MKNQIGISEAFTAQATIRAGYWMMQQAQMEFEKEENKLSPIAKMIDEATGHDKEKLKKHKQYLCICLIDIIEAKKLIEADYSRDAEFLARLTTPTHETT